MKYPEKEERERKRERDQNEEGKTAQDRIEDVEMHNDRTGYSTITTRW